MISKFLKSYNYLKYLKTYVCMEIICIRKEYLKPYNCIGIMNMRKNC